MPLYSPNLACRIHGVMSLTPYSQPPVGIETHHSMLLVSSPLHSSLCALLPSRVARWRALSNGTLVGRWLPKPIRSNRPPRDCDEAHFWLNGYVNKQNCRIWSEANPQVYVETPLHQEKLTVWCALWAGGILLQKR
ncbi:hypothetical protein TNCV_4403301 [Trichonephila clavipes]|uniref:Uncharacterized protein n=1 Tax=Trichonephila clavipes TaxID=2585209 RepID=A0A8X6VF66_TRICX|nr:hypothetical protein TNCV_4403301 [Trichonephila clavipes]